jgi:hypothetical protein
MADYFQLKLKKQILRLRSGFRLQAPACKVGSGSGSPKNLYYAVLIHRFRDERLPKGPRFASESLDADTASGSVF